MPSFSFMIASSQVQASNWTMDDVPDMRPPRGVIWAIKIPFGRTVSITFDSALKAIIL
jgi:hypothetical protein